jgi:uncharacterized protein (DUF433 family)
MKVFVSHSVGEKGRRLLALLVNEIRRGRIKKRQPRTFISYGEVLEKLNIPRRGREGQQLQREGLTELNEWTKQSPDLPKIAGLIIDKKRRLPGLGYAKSHGHGATDWREWWLTETDEAIDFDWSPYLARKRPPAQSAARVREGEEDEAPDSRRIVTVEAGKRGGRAYIRGMRITVGDILRWLAAGKSEKDVIRDHPELTREDIRAALAFAAQREEQAVGVSPGSSQLASFASKWAGKFKLPKPDPADPRLTYLLERYHRNRS